MNARNSFMLFYYVVIIAYDVGTMGQSMYSTRSSILINEHPIEQDPLDLDCSMETYAHVSSAKYDGLDAKTLFKYL